jgi:hypothetical protein
MSEGASEVRVFTNGNIQEIEAGPTIRHEGKLR